MAAITPSRPAASEQSRPISADANDFTWTASAGSSDTILFSGKRILLLVRNDNAGAQTVTVTSVAKGGRVQSITAYSVGASEYAHLGPFSGAGWANASGQLDIATSHANIMVAAMHVQPMPLKVVATVQGAKELNDAFKQLGLAVSKGVIRSAQKKALRPTARAARAMAPRGVQSSAASASGSRVLGSTHRRLAESIVVQPQIARHVRRRRTGPRRGIEMRVGVLDRVWYAHLVEYGHLLVKGKGADRKVIGSVGARPFMRPAWQETKNGILPILGKELWKSLARAAKRLNRQAQAGKLSKRGRAIFGK